MLTKEEAANFLNKLKEENRRCATTYGQDVENVLREFTEKSEISTQEDTKRALQIVIDVVGYMNDEHKWGHYHNFNVQKSLEAAEELLENKNVD